ncbi:hypothetical protein [Streptomyces sp. CA-251247]|uniref:hypothetical protein n=1 Tax=Streptomyces sp. CA-251247 TaxID=3240062 RepID=UPI003D8D62E4
MLAGQVSVLVHNCDFGPGKADEKYDKHVLGLDDHGNPTRTPDMPEYDYDGGFEQMVDDAKALMCSDTCPVGAQETRRTLNGVTTIIRLDSQGRVGMRVGNKITTYFRPGVNGGKSPQEYFDGEANR